MNLEKKMACILPRRHLTYHKYSAERKAQHVFESLGEKKNLNAFWLIASQSSQIIFRCKEKRHDAKTTLHIAKMARREHGNKVIWAFIGFIKKNKTSPS